MLPLSLKNKAEKVIFLDLDGVVFDSYGLWDEVIEQVLSHANIPYTQSIKKQLWRLNMIEAQEYLASLFAQQNVVYQAKKVKEQLVKAYQKVLLMPQSTEFLADLSREGYVIYAVTSNYDDLAKIGLESKGVLKYFFKIYSCIEEGFADKTKDFFRNLLEKEGLKSEQIIYLEDSVRNLEEAARCGIKGIYLSNTDNPQDNQGQRCYTIRCLNDFKKL
ncbi:HAD family hydrolase [Streptococcus sp. SL1232]|uniref:HAD family hydrolase n=1 Tax=Streptococcus vicugnae TaxID=2740579 RepID=UPI0018F61328|nr:HAD family hydrolase [Streptococcus vicugnae]MBJ7540896.1 HAD family hydrolase [Streptococcus vicugnae]